MRSSRSRDNGHSGLKLIMLMQLMAANEMLQRVLTLAPAAPATWFRPAYVQRLMR